ncbi:MAG: fumarylacetoacetate hydrolase family protein [Betaproteobacteria bacterium]|nr:fumarylacetoacetate hydrolase family protein [Betaproteobacteria bacterium]
MRKPKPVTSTARAAAKHLLEAHERREPFAPLPPALAPRTAEDAYAIQDSFVALRAERLGAIGGYKIALSSKEMQRFVGVNEPQAGVMLESTLHQTPARVRAADYVHLIIEFEIAFRMAADLPVADAPYTRASLTPFIEAVMPAIEIADDRHADYSKLAKHPLELIADNAWNEGAVLGAPIERWRDVDLGAVRGVATINGKVVGEGVGAAAMGHPLDSLAWVANHLAAHHRGLVFRDVVITGSIITTKTVQPGELVKFEIDRLGGVELRVV